MTPRPLAAAILISAAGLAGPAGADRFDALRNDPEIESGVTIVAIAEAVRDACPQFEPRRVAAAAFFWGLVNRARDLGYTNDEIRAYVDSDADKARVEARALQWLAERGADPDTPETVCAVARDEISAGTAIGRLVRER